MPPYTPNMFFQDGLTGSAWGDWALYTVGGCFTLMVTATSPWFSLKLNFEMSKIVNVDKPKTEHRKSKSYKHEIKYMEMTDSKWTWFETPK